MGTAAGHANLGYLLAATGQYELARQEYRKALAIRPDLTSPAHALAQLDRQQRGSPGRDRTEPHRPGRHTPRSPGRSRRYPGLCDGCGGHEPATTSTALVDPIPQAAEPYVTLRHEMVRNSRDATVDLYGRCSDGQAHRGSPMMT